MKLYALVSSNARGVAVKRTHPLLRVAAVVSSVVLVGGFVGYRAGAFSWLAETSAGPIDPQSKPTTDTTQVAPGMLPGSKTNMFLDPLQIPPEPPQKIPPEPLQTLMSSSKSGQIVSHQAVTSTRWAIPDPVHVQSPAPTQRPPTFMGGIKSAPVFVSPTMQWAVPSVLNGPPAGIPPPAPTKNPDTGALP